MALLWFLMMSVSFYENKKDYDACKKEEFKPKVCQKWTKKRELPNW